MRKITENTSKTSSSVVLLIAKMTSVELTKVVPIFIIFTEDSYLSLSFPILEKSTSSTIKSVTLL